MPNDKLTEQLVQSLNKSLVARLAEACDATSGVPKKGSNEAQHYKYQKASDVAKEFRHELFKRGIVVIPNEQDPVWRDYQTKSGSIMRECQLAVEYLITDGTDKMAFIGHGVAADSGDKAIYKAKTGSLKYFLRGLGLLPDEADDPENDKEKFDRDTIPAKIEAIKAGTPRKSDPVVFEHFIHEDGKTGEASMLVRKVIDKMTAKSAKSPNGSPYVWVQYGEEDGKSLTCFDKKLFEELKASIGSTIKVMFKVSDKGWSITSIVPEQMPADNPDAEPAGEDDDFYNLATV